MSEGDHILDDVIFLSNTELFHIMNITESGRTKVTCSEHAGLVLSSVSQVHISGITFVGCDGTFQFIGQMTIKGSSFSGQDNSNVNVSRVSVSGSNVNILRSQFLSNTAGTFRSFSSSVGGALVISNSTVMIDNCLFENNKAKFGGAIFSEMQSNITVLTTMFVSNHATGCDSTENCLGGAMYIDGTSTLSLHKSTFQNNTADESGGAVFIFLLSADNSVVEYGNMGSLYSSVSSNTSHVFEATTFNNNRASNGGALYIYGSSITISNCDFTNNEVERYGGAIVSFSGSEILLSHCQLLSNFAATDGGAISVNNGTTHIDNSNFVNNIANGNGGVLFVDNFSTVTLMENCLFDNNSADGEGGGVVFAQLESSVLFDSCELMNNNGISGGVMLLKESSLGRINNCSCRHNQASRRGGVIYANRVGSQAVITSSNFSYNKAMDYGGVVTLRYGSELIVNDSLFEHNSAVLEAGVFDGYFETNLEIYGSTFQYNTANLGGVAAIYSNSTFNCEGSTFYSNVDADLGAVIRALADNEVSFHSCNFSDNSANYGGTITATTNNTVNVFNCSFYGNQANNDGGVVYARIDARVTISDSLFVSNGAINDGITLASDNSSMSFTNSTFLDNVVGHDGGVAYAYVNSSIIIRDCVFNNNRAENSGGVAYGRNKCTISITNSSLDNSIAQSSGGGVHAQDNSLIFIEGSNITNNMADYGGGLRVYVSSSANVSNSLFTGNVARVAGGAMAAYERSTLIIHASDFVSNTANIGGVMIAYQNSDTVVFGDNSTTVANGALQRSIVDISDSNFVHNRANFGGVMYVQSGNVTIKSCTFDDNRARYDAGAINALSNSYIDIFNTTFIGTVAEENGGVLRLIANSTTKIEKCHFFANRAAFDGGVVHALQSTAHIINSTINSSVADVDGGGLYALSSMMEVVNTIFMNNIASTAGGAMYATTNSTVVVQGSHFINNFARNSSGGALYLTSFTNANLFDSNFQFNVAYTRGGAVYARMHSSVLIASSNFSENLANIGGALTARISSFIRFYTSHNTDSITAIPSSAEVVRIYNNSAISGGGIYLAESELYLSTTAEIMHNSASTSGGGVYAINSSITNENIVYFVTNAAASEGGGISLVNSKLNYANTSDMPTESIINFLSNVASFGGAIYVDDKSEETICSNNPYTGEYYNASECFFHSAADELMLNFGNNSVIDRGQDLFGGLLDRCTVDSTANHFSFELTGITRLKEIANLATFNTVSSDPVQLCLCDNTNFVPNCSRSMMSVQVRNKDTFSIFVAAMDQVYQMVPATIQSRLQDINLTESQRIRRIDAICSDLEYRVVFPNASRTYDLILFPQGPCADRGNSRLTISVDVLSCSCPYGFVPANVDTECSCVCDDRYEMFSKVIQTCDYSTKTVIRHGQYWMRYFSEFKDEVLGPYFIYPFCPFDYCLPSSASIPINLNLPDGSDAQCANNRGGLLCGSCRQTYSLSLGSTKCLLCHDKWQGRLAGIILASLFAGIILVVFLLVLNLTVAIGTFNSIIFYANIINANESVYFSQQHIILSYIPVFISWLNLDIGFDTCFFEGMDAYAKTWLQLAFPIFIIFLVVMIIWISSCSTRFSTLIGKRNPVATLATLILLSYTKLLQVVITSFSFVVLKYPNGQSETHWLPDASIKYNDGKLIALVCVAALILVLGLLYTILIFSWQWLLRLSTWKLFAWTKNQKLNTFINTYNAPYTAKHRYWTGLLLFVRVVVYLINAFSVSIDPRITPLFTALIMCSLIMYKTFWMMKMYKNRFLNVMESFVFFNIAVFATVTVYTFNDLDNVRHEVFQTATHYVSIGTIIILCVVVVLFHVCRYSNSKLYSKVQNTTLGRKLTAHHSLSRERPIQLENRLFDVMDRHRSIIGYRPPEECIQQNSKVTTSSLILENCTSDASDKCTYPLEHHNYKAMHLENRGHKPHQQTRHGDDADFIPRAKSEAGSTRSTEVNFDLRRKTAPNMTELTSKENERNITKPLLEEHQSSY